MRAYAILILFTIALMAAGYIISPMVEPYMGNIKYSLIALKQFCHDNPVLGYVIYGSLLALTILLGLPFLMAIMLLAGITFNFWEATMLVAISRLVMAVVGFLLVRHMIFGDEKLADNPPALLQKFEHHPKIGLLLARLSPLPDTTVNYAMGATSLNCFQYAIISLIGILPFTLLCVWIGNELGSITQLIQILN